MKKILLTLALSLSLSILPSCKEDITNAEDNRFKSAKVMVPLAIGNEWVYRYSYRTVHYLDSTHYEENILDSIRFDTIRIVDKKILNNEEWYVATHSDPKQVWKEELMRNTASGFESKDNDSQLHFSKFVKYPLQENDVFLMQNKFRTKTGLNNKIYTWDEFKYVFSIVNIESFNGMPDLKCYQLCDTLTNNENYPGWFDYKYVDYYSPGIGLVQQVEYLTDSITGHSFSIGIYRQKIDLMSYKLN